MTDNIDSLLGRKTRVKVHVTQVVFTKLITLFASQLCVTLGQEGDIL